MASETNNHPADAEEIRAEIQLVEMELREVRLWGKHGAGPNRRIAAGRREKKLESELEELRQTLGLAA